MPLRRTRRRQLLVAGVAEHGVDDSLQLGIQLFELVLIMALLPVQRRWSMSGILGHRFASVSNLNFDKQGSSIDADYSGFLARLGLAYDWK